MKIKNFLFSIILLCIWFIPYSCFADLKPENIELECTYENGMVLYFYADKDSRNSITYGISHSTITLSNQISLSTTGSATVFYNEAVFAKRALTAAACPQHLRQAYVYQYNTEEDSEGNISTNSMYFDLFFHDVDQGAWNDKEFLKKGHIRGFTATDAYSVGVYVDPESALYTRRDTNITSSIGNPGVFQYNLVSEKIRLLDDVEPLSKMLFQSEGQQAASKQMYVRIYQYKLSNGNKAYFAEKDGVMTNVASPNTTYDDKKIIFICFGESTQVIDSGRNDSGISYSKIKHQVLWNPTAYDEKDVDKEFFGNYNCYTEGTLPYHEVAWQDPNADGADGTSICTVIPNTAIILAKIINWAKIIVPVFLIILTGIDISKIVIAGNIEEELPKKRKTMIIRFIVAIVFFFLPLFVQVITAASYGVDFGDISCLWE